MDRHMGERRGRVPVLGPCGSLNYFCGLFLPGFLWPIILICLVHSSYLVYLRILPCVHASLSQDGFFHMWVEHPWAWLRLWPTRSLSVYMWCRRSSDFRNEKCLGRAQPPPLVVLLFLVLEKSTRNESPIALPWGSPSPSCHSLNIKVKVAQSCLTLCDPMNYTVHAILQARILEWAAIAFSDNFG